ncbi:hypothetical protein NUM_43020 [Actinocatenispora comari]|jgi:hypothetical protein|uniref:Uncharacterized protein n=1 Tax=Actinocatenispora comari TaxID=2807577 RepID=A0A8J4EMR2_9ACTN|nr:hypothetical protein NUM_43020 [Actinocatenispora comari]
MSAALDYLPPTGPAATAKFPSCRHCFRPIQLALLNGTWSWTHLTPARCRYCSESIRPVGESWVHVPRPTYACPERLRTDGEITFAAPAEPCEVTLWRQ